MINIVNHPGTSTLVEWSLSVATLLGLSNHENETGVLWGQSVHLYESLFVPAL